VLRIVRSRTLLRTVVAIASAGIGGVALAQAGDPTPRESQAPPAWPERPLMFEVAGFGALSVGGHFRLDNGGAVGTGNGSSLSLADHGAFALAADLRIDEGSQYELFYSREASDLRGNFSMPRTNVTVEYLHIGGTLLLDDEPKIKPYLVGGLGITRFTPGAQGNTDTRFSASLGLGLRWPVTRHFSVRLEGRGFVTLVNPDAAVFCRSDQAGLLCRIRGSGQTFLQGEFLAGAAFAF
jgi:opacity protein-like surface antigen